MRNLSLHPLWHTVMPAYEHSVGALTHALSALAIYLMLTKTPKASRHFVRYLMLLQVSITLVDLNFGFLTCPIALFPMPGGLCNGLLCTVFGLTGHVGNILMFVSMSSVAISINFCFHFKFIGILAMTKHIKVEQFHNIIFRVFIVAINSVICLMFMGIHRNTEGGNELVLTNYPTLHYVLESDEHSAVLYDLSVDFNYTVLFTIVTITVIVLDLGFVAFFVAASFHLLAHQKNLSEKTKHIQRNSMKTLSIQASVPGIVQSAPMCVNVYSIIADSLTPDINNIVFCFELSHAFAHTSILILTTPRYRQALIFWRSKN